MADERQLIKETDRARAAQTLIEHPLMVEVWETLRNAYVAALVDGPVTDLELLKDLKITIRLIDQLKTEFEGIIKTGELASRQIEGMKDGRRS